MSFIEWQKELIKSKNDLINTIDTEFKLTERIEKLINSLVERWKMCNKSKCKLNCNSKNCTDTEMISYRRRIQSDIKVGCIKQSLEEGNNGIIER